MVSSCDHCSGCDSSALLRYSHRVVQSVGSVNKLAIRMNFDVSCPTPVVEMRDPLTLLFWPIFWQHRDGRESVECTDLWLIQECIDCRVEFVHRENQLAIRVED